MAPVTNSNVAVVPGNTEPIIGITTPPDFPSPGETQGASPTDTDLSTSAPGETSSAPAATTTAAATTTSATTTTSAATTTTKASTAAPAGPPGRFLQSGETPPSPARAQYHQLRKSLRHRYGSRLYMVSTRRGEQAAARHPFTAPALARNPSQ